MTDYTAYKKFLEKMREGCEATPKRPPTRYELTFGPRIAKLFIGSGLVPPDPCMKYHLGSKALKLTEKTGIPHMVYGIKIIALDGDLRGRSFKQVVEHALALLDKWIREGVITEEEFAEALEKNKGKYPLFFNDWVETHGLGYVIPRVDLKQLEKWRRKHGRKNVRKKAKKKQKTKIKI